MIARISKADKSVRGTIHLPPSKSIYNRVQIIRALCNEHFKIFPEATPQDSALLQILLSSSLPVLDAEDGGTTFRFMTAYLAQKPGEWFLTGSARMKERPIGILVEALRSLGAEISYKEKEGYPPLKINGKKLKGGSVRINGNVSSQFISALLMIAPTFEGGIRLTLGGEVLSRTYISMTLRLMGEFGINYDWKENVIYVPKQKYIPKDYHVEADWSSASYWFEIAALAEEADISLPNLNMSSLQGDAKIAGLMQHFGINTEYTNNGIRLTKQKNISFPKNFSYNFQSHPDLVQTLTVTCAALNANAEFTGVQSLRIKETDRLTALQNELSKTGVRITITDKRVSMQTSNLKPETSKLNFQTYNDHRMALALTPLALEFNQVDIENPDVVRKSYPDFWKDLERVGFNVELIKTESAPAL